MLGHCGLCKDRRPCKAWSMNCHTVARTHSTGTVTLLCSYGCNKVSTARISSLSTTDSWAVAHPGRVSVLLQFWVTPSYCWDCLSNELLCCKSSCMADELPLLCRFSVCPTQYHNYNFLQNRENFLHFFDFVHFHDNFLHFHHFFLHS